jgi:gliding motility-associated-like protein
MKWLASILITLFSLWGYSQIQPVGNSGVRPTSYTNGQPNNSVYIWCGTGSLGSLSYTPTSGTAPYTFNWFQYSNTSFSWNTYTTQNGATSQVNNLPNGGYRVEVYSSNGTLVACDIAWVWTANNTVTANNTLINCSSTNLTGTNTTTPSSFNYYNPPPPQSLINAGTQITVCFTGTHTWVSDLGFYLIGPAACGSPTITLSPNPGSNGQPNACNSGNDFNNLCFTTAASPNLNVCNATTPLTGTYDSYGAGATPINWAGLVGCNAAQGGWRVQVFDCVSLDVGSLTNATITFSNLTSICGSPTTINYNSGNINSAINDNSCSLASASVYQVPPPNNLTTPITINGTTTQLWSSSPASTITTATSLNTTATGLTGVTTFSLTSTFSVGGTQICQNVATTTFSPTPITNPTANNVSYCENDPATPLQATGTSLLWYTSATGGTGSAVAPTPVTTTPGTTSYWVTQTLNGCESGRVEVIVTVKPKPIVDPLSDISVCINGVVSPVTFTGTAGSQFNWANNNTATGLGQNGINTTTQFTATATGTSVVTVTPTLNGCTGNSISFNIVVANSITPLFTQVQPICSGSSLTPLPTTSNNAIVGSWSPALNNTSTTTYTFTPTSACATTQTMTIVVNPIPVITQVQNQQVCVGLQTSAINFQVTPSSASIGWSSSVNIGITSPGTGNIPAFTTQNTGTNPVTSQFSAVASSGGCTSQPMDFTITVNSRPNVIASSNSPQCVNSQINFQSSGGVTYLWQGPGGWTSNLQNPQITNTSTTQSGTYTVFVTDAYGCEGLATLPVQINPLPQVSATSNSPVCEGSSINLFAGLNNVSSFSWVGPGGFNSNLPSPVITATSASAGSYTLTAQNQFGCINADVVQVVVNQSPPAPITTPVTYCQDATSNPVFANPNGSTDLLWWGTSSTGGTSQSTAPTPQTTNTGTTNYYVSGLLNGCESVRSFVAVTVLPRPNGVIASVSPKCEPLCTWIRLSSSNSITNWNWDIGFGPVTGNNNDSIYNCYSEPGQYTIKVSLVDANGCTNNLVFPNWVVVYENPVASFSANPNETTLIEPDVIFTNNSVGVNSLSWNFGDGVGLISTVNTISHTYSSIGTYTVKLLVTTSNSCTDTASATISIVEDINIFIPNSFSPNGDGINDEFFPTGTGLSKENYSMEIYNRWGEMIFSTTDLSEHWKGNNSGTTLQDTFVYKINLKTTKGNKIVRTGTVTLIR